MPDRERKLAEEVAVRALAASRAPETEVVIAGGRESLTRFAGNTIHQNMTRGVLDVSIRTADGGRTGRASTTRTDDEALAETAARALSVARRLEPLPDLLPVPEPYDSYPETRCWSGATSAASAERRASGVSNVVNVAMAEGLTTAGSFTSDDRFEAVANSRGLFAFGEYTSSVLSMTMTGPTSTGYAEDGSSSIDRIHVETLARRAAEKAFLSASPGEVPPGEYTAILEPVAVGELLIYLLHGNNYSHFSGLALLEGQSFFAGRMGQKLFGDAITLRDDILHPMQWGVPFDAEGVPRRALTLIDRGVVKAVTYDRGTAKKAGAEPTGHGLQLPNTFGSAPQNLVLEGGTTSVEEMIRTTERGILVTRLWYNRLVDPAEMIVTGLTRDGTFLVENGRIVKGLRNYRFNQSLVRMLNQITALSPAVRAGSGMVAPALRVEGFNFSAVVPRET